MELPFLRPGFIERAKNETIAKLITLVLLDREFTEDVREAASFADYMNYVGQKRKRTIYETLFYIAPDAEQRNVWSVIRGGKDE